MQFPANQCSISLRNFCIVKVKTVVGWQKASVQLSLSQDMQFHSAIYNDKCLTQQKKKSHRVIWLCSGKLARGSGS